MREILFRGKRKDNGEWACSGNLIQFFDNNIREVYISQYGERCNAVHDIDTDNIETITCENGARFYKVIPETVGQYTGLTDKNGKKIFEGDIVRYQFDNDDCPFPNKRTEPILGRVFFSDFRASFSVTAGRNGGSALNNDLFKYVQNGNRVEVIGNINDNPELLKVGDDK